MNAADQIGQAVDAAKQELLTQSATENAQVTADLQALRDEIAALQGQTLTDAQLQSILGKVDSLKTDVEQSIGGIDPANPTPVTP